MSLLALLDDSQQEAARHDLGPAVVFAGPGSGKTRILTTRIGLLIEKGIRPEEILGVTFTNKAAREISERLRHLTPLGWKVPIGTFHSLCARWLREFAPHLGFTSDFTIYDDQDSLSVIKALMKEARVPFDKQISPQEMRFGINELKTHGFLPQDEKSNPAFFREVLPVGGSTIFKGYQENLALSNAMDFNDLLLNVLLLLRKNEEFRKTLQRRYKYVLVDEFQDTNDCQYELLWRLCGFEGNLFVVGDDDQSIYSWRGAIPRYILEFKDKFPGAKVYELKKNYRSTQLIFDSAQAMIGCNKKRFPKQIEATREKGLPITYKFEIDQEFEAWSAVKSILDEKQEYPFRDTVILYRTNAQSRAIEDVLRRENVPYKIVGSVRFYDRLEVKDLLAYVRLLVNPKDDVSLRRILNVPTRGLGDAALTLLQNEARERQVSLFDAIDGCAEKNLPRVSGKLQDFRRMLRQISADITQEGWEFTAEIILRHTKYHKHLEKKFPETFDEKMDNIHELSAAMMDYRSKNPDVSLAEWLQSISLLSEADKAPEDSVTLMTLHAAKGLEYRRVYILGLEEGVLPHRNSLESQSALEEERRLFYVGMTRAKDKLTLLLAESRRLHDRYERNAPSRFLKEIPKTNLVSVAGLPDYSGEEEEESFPGEPRYVSAESESQLTGQRVFHPAYGKGIIESHDEAYGHKFVVVQFSEFGRRRVKLAHLEGEL